MSKRAIPSRLQQAKQILEELELQEVFYLDESNDDKQMLIYLYEKMHRQLKILVRAEQEAYLYAEQYVRKKLVRVYLKYGTYLKSTQKDFEAARSCLLKALKLTKDVPIAYYRLGFLAYKRGAYAEALLDFQRAISVQGEQEYQLSVKQQAYAQLYLANSALYVAQGANAALENLPEPEQLVSYELSPIFAQLSNQEQFLAANSFYRFSADGVETCSVRECEWVCETLHTLVLYFSDRENACFYNGRAVSLSVNLADTLRHLLLMCSAQHPGRRYDFAPFFDRLADNGEVRADAFRQRMSRLRAKLAQIGLNHVIRQTRVQLETAYYVEELPFFVLYRVDEQTAYDYAHLL